MEIAENVFASDLRELVSASGLTMKEVAERLEVPYRTMQDWRAGRRTPPKYQQDLILQKLKEISKKSCVNPA